MLEDIEYNFFYKQTEHPLVQEYFSLRTKCFVKKWNLKNFSGVEDEYDRNAHILILHKNGKCLGGGRVILKKVYENLLLPMETNSFQLAEKLPDLNLEKYSYAELSRSSLGGAS